MNSESFSAIQYSDASRSGLSRPENLRIEKALGMVGTNKKALDIGAYNGAISKKIKALGNEVWATDATDAFSPEFSSAGIEFVKSNIEEKLPYEDNKFDVVFAGEVLEHLVNTDGFVEEIKRILKKDGYLILTTHNTASLARRILLLLGRNPFFEASFTHAGKLAAGHLRYFTFDLLLDFLNFHGLEVVERTSDVVNFSGSISSALLAKIFPALGRSIILKVVKTE
ncbi:hypothetical protein A2200_02560 [candidate division WWE3 bacterium RIFOXYA1_FULL_41_11]|nr:MAG: hypothetical protein A2200_02560 [candidate division WWE3 bacterium RIFOXYA1_FULL_41_11]